MRRFRSGMIGVAAACALAVGVPVAASGSTEGATPSTTIWEGVVPSGSIWEGTGLADARLGSSFLGGTVFRDLLIARMATAKYHSVDRAVEDGYEPVFGCLYFPDGYMDFGPGAMGQHYYNPDLFGDVDSLDPARPELLVYEPDQDGELRLIAAEWAVPDSDPPASEPPVMFGREMMFHPQFDAWAVHVWLWRPNPYGLFADVNPRVGCEYSDQPEPRPRD